MMRKLFLFFGVLLLLVGSGILIYLKVKPIPTNPYAIGDVSTLAGAGYPGTEDGSRLSASFSDPFGIAVDQQGDVIVADGGKSNRMRRITPEGNVETMAGSVEGFADGSASVSAFNTPSHIALDGSGNLIIADTSNNRIRKLTLDGRVITVAGSGLRGEKDGLAAEAEFDGPIGVAVDAEGNVFVADSYNDWIRKISPDGLVSTIAGAGAPGFRDGKAATARFDTPCGVAVDGQGNLFVADTGNHAIRKVTPQGDVTTIAGGEPGRVDGRGWLARFDQPTGIAVTHDGYLFVTDAGSGRIRRITPEADVSTLAGGATGFADGIGRQAGFNRPSGIAVDGEGNVYVADAQNYLIRRIAPVAPESASIRLSGKPGPFIQPPLDISRANPLSIVPRLSVKLFDVGSSFPWPLNPQRRWHEVTGVMGEARGAPGGIAVDHLHSGVDIRGALGEPVVSVLDQKVNHPLPTWGFDTTGEGIRAGLMTYVHIRVGRNRHGEIQAPEKFKPRYDEMGELIGVRVRRGARFKVGEFVGTINRLYHVHLNFGPWNAQANPLQFPFVDFKDTIRPTIERGGIEVIDSAGQPFREKRQRRLVISGDVDIVVTAYDRVNGNVSYRKLGLYKAGYQILKDDGTPVKGFEQPLINIEFNRLPPGGDAVSLTYAPGSGVSAYGTPTRFKYIVTNRVRDGKARDGFLRTTRLAPGNYILKLIAQDYAGNRASGKSTELRVRVEKTSE